MRLVCIDAPVKLGVKSTDRYGRKQIQLLPIGRGVIVREGRDPPLAAFSTLETRRPRCPDAGMSAVPPQRQLRRTPAPGGGFLLLMTAPSPRPIPPLVRLLGLLGFKMRQDWREQGVALIEAITTSLQEGESSCGPEARQGAGQRTRAMAPSTPTVSMARR